MKFKFKFSFLLALSATLVAGCAAYYSVFGLSQLFAGASTAVIIMASSLEFSKIVTVSFLQRYWKNISTGLKIYLMIGVMVLVSITSAGIYGFLSNAYQKTANKLEISEAGTKVLSIKKELYEKNISDNQIIINAKNTRLLQLNNLRANQETRLDAADNGNNKRTARADIDIASKEIQKLNNEIDIINLKNTVLLDSVNVLSAKIIEFQSTNDVASEIGPLKYLAQLTGYNMDKIVNWFILLLIFVFDPLAVALVIATNKMLEIEKNGDDNLPHNPLISKLNQLFVNKKDIKQSTDELIADLDNEDDIDVGENLDELYDGNDAPLEPENQQQVTVTKEVESEPIVELPKDVPEIVFRRKKEPVISTGKVELQDIKEIKEKSNRGFSVNIPKPSNNAIERIGANKMFKDNNKNQVIFKRNNL